MSDKTAPDTAALLAQYHSAWTSYDALDPLTFNPGEFVRARDAAWQRVRSAKADLAAALRAEQEKAKALQRELNDSLLVQATARDHAHESQQEYDRIHHLLDSASARLEVVEHAHDRKEAEIERLRSALVLAERFMAAPANGARLDTLGVVRAALAPAKQEPRA